jgi:hypothetical protein
LAKAAFLSALIFVVLQPTSAEALEPAVVRVGSTGEVLEDCANSHLDPSLEVMVDQAVEHGTLTGRCVGYFLVVLGYLQKQALDMLDYHDDPYICAPDHLSTYYAVTSAPERFTSDIANFYKTSATLELEVIDVLISVAINVFHCEKHVSLYIPVIFEHIALDYEATRGAAERVELEDFSEAPIGDLYTVYLNLAGARYFVTHMSAHGSRRGSFINLTADWKLTLKTNHQIVTPHQTFAGKTA